MSRLLTAGLTVALSLTLLAVPAFAADWAEEYEGDRGQVAEPARENGEVSVDLEGAAPTPEAFRSTLSAYGDWYVSPRYGNVWRPRVAVGWRPYYYGSWLWTDEGWYWDSAEPFA